MEEVNPVLHQAILEAVENQLTALDPPETRRTYDRLIAAGNDDAEARRLIGCVLAGEIYGALSHRRTFDRIRFVSRLEKLPDLSWMDGER